MTTPVNPSQYVDLQPEATAILQTVSELDRAYGVNYLVRLLRADDSYDWRQPDHPSVSTFGALQAEDPERLRQAIFFLAQEGLLEISDARYGSLQLTDTGEAYLADPQPMSVRRSQLRVKPYDRLLQQALREVRKTFAQEQTVPPFRVFTNHTLDQIVLNKPQTLQDLKLIPGFGNYKANRYGPAVLQTVARIATQKEEDAQIKLQKKIRTPAYQSVKAMFLAGLSEAEMSAKRKVQPLTIRRTLIDLHQTGEIDLSTWITTIVPAEVLAKGTAYFEQKDSSRLKGAYEALGLDYETLRLCRLYVATHAQSETDIQLAS